MEKIIKEYFVMIMVLTVFIISACNEETDAGGENPYSSEIKIVNQQVWKHNKYAKKVSDALLKYNGDHEFVCAFTVKSEPNGSKFNIAQKILDDSGKIENGILNFSVHENDMAEKLIDFYSNCGINCKSPCEDDEIALESWFREWKNVKIDKSDTKGNVILVYDYLPALPPDRPIPEPNGPLDRHRFNGTRSSMTMETILYIYVDRDCRITGDSDNGYLPGNYYYYSKEKLNLHLKKGFNLVTRGEKYLSSGSGSAYISMKVRNPIHDPESFKWVIESGFEF